jgi:hypothetical protein
MTAFTKEQLNQFAERAGFGGNQRNTYRVRLELFAKMVESATIERLMKEFERESGTQQ